MDDRHVKQERVQAAVEWAQNNPVLVAAQARMQAFGEVALPYPADADIGTQAVTWQHISMDRLVSEGPMVLVGQAFRAAVTAARRIAAEVGADPDQMVERMADIYDDCLRLPDA